MKKILLIALSLSSFSLWAECEITPVKNYLQEALAEALADFREIQMNVLRNYKMEHLATIEGLDSNRVEFRSTWLTETAASNYIDSKGCSFGPEATQNLQQKLNGQLLQQHQQMIQQGFQNVTRKFSQEAYQLFPDHAEKTQALIDNCVSARTQTENQLKIEMNKLIYCD